MDPTLNAEDLMQKCRRISRSISVTSPPSSSTVTSLFSAGLRASASISRTSPVEPLFIFRANISRWSSFLGQALRGTAGYFLLPPHTHYSVCHLRRFQCCRQGLRLDSSIDNKQCCKSDSLSIINWKIHRSNSFRRRFCCSFCHCCPFCFSCQSTILSRGNVGSPIITTKCGPQRIDAKLTSIICPVIESYSELKLPYNLLNNSALYCWLKNLVVFSISNNNLPQYKENKKGNGCVGRNILSFLLKKEKRSSCFSFVEILNLSFT